MTESCAHCAVNDAVVAALTAALAELVDACMLADESVVAPDKQSIMRARARLPGGVKWALERRK